MISANGGLPTHRYTPQVTQRWPRGSEPASFVRSPSDGWAFRASETLVKVTQQCVKVVGPASLGGELRLCSPCHRRLVLAVVSVV